MVGANSTSQAVHTGRPNFFARYWRGEVSLPRSYWGVSFLVNIAVSLFLGLLAMASARLEYDPLRIWLNLLASWAFLTAVSVWQLVGVWRSAANYIDRRLGWRPWGWLARGATVISALALLSIFLKTGAPQIVETTKMAFLNDPDIPSYTLALSTDRKELDITGGIKYGLASKVESLLRTTPSVNVVNLASRGGRIGEAEKLFKIISAHGLNTVVNAGCFSACTIAFAGGHERWLGPSGHLGFHSGAFVGATQAQLYASTRQTLDQIAAQDGVDKGFLTRAFSVPSTQLWQPTREELLKARYITQLRSGATSSLVEIQRALQKIAAKMKFSVRLDPVTSLVGVKVELEKFIYVYDVDTALVSVSAIASPATGAMLRSKVCGNKDMREDVSRGVIYGYLYRDVRQNKTVAYHEIPDC